MLVFLYLTFLITALYWVSKILLPELNKLPSSKAAPKSNSIYFSQTNRPDERIEKLEIFMAEKDKSIIFLQKELRILYAQVRAFDEVKALLDGEIHRLREQNRIFRSELGLPAVQPKEKSIT